MTVCIAAIYNNNSILGVSDRMITGGDIEFEPLTPKILNITNSIGVMTAGDQNIQIQVFQEASKEINEKINRNPNKWLYVSDVADIYSSCYYKLRNKLIENGVLLPYGLNYDSFIARQKEMNHDFINNITRRVDGFSIRNIGDIAAILTGIDESGPHIYVVENGVISCNDKLGFASIGIGSNHALSHFMFSSYSRYASEPKALLTIYQAKKKAEASPGVGEQTDMCHIGPRPGTFQMITESALPRPIIKDLDKFYKDYRKKIDKLDKNIEDKIKDYLKSFIQQAQAGQQATNPNTSASPVLQEPIKEEK